LSKSRKRKSRGTRGSITCLERGISSTGSEEELFRQRNDLQLPLQGVHEGAGAIKVTRDIEVRSSKQDRDYLQGVDF
jgi:hypothetical protein